MRYPKLRPAPWDGAVILITGLLAVSLILARFPGLSGMTAGASGKEPELWAVVYADGIETDRVPLDSGGEAEEKDYQNNGYTVHAAFRPDGEAAAQVIYADCPTQVCVHTGRIARTGQAVICLPSRIVIRLEGSAENNTGPDAVLGQSG